MDTIRNKRISDTLFYIYFIVMFGAKMLGLYEGMMLYNLALLMGAGAWALHMATMKFSVREYIMIVLFLGLGGLVYLRSGEKGILIYFTLMLAMKGKDIVSLFKAGAVTGAVCMVVKAFWYVFGFMMDPGFVQERNFWGVITRHALGYAHPNTLATTFVILSMMILYVVGNEDKKKLTKVTALLLAVSFYIYFYSLSRTGLLISVGYLFLNYVYAFRSRITLIEKVLLALLLPAEWILCIIIPFFASWVTLEKLRGIDENLYSRWNLARYFYDNNSFSLFGMRLNNPNETTYGIDMSQAYLILQLGIVTFAVMMLLWGLAIVRGVKKCDFRALVIIVSLILMGTTEPFLYNTAYKNIAFVFVGVAVYALLGARECEDEPKEISFSAKAKFDRKIIIPVLGILLASAIAFVKAPTPEYIMIDRSAGKGEFCKIGRTYTYEQVTDLEKKGKLVVAAYDQASSTMEGVNLTTMAYADAKNPYLCIYHEPGAAMMEKVRFYVSIFIWGTAIIFGIYYAVITRHEQLQKD